MESFLRAVRSQWQPHEGQKAFLDCDAKIRVLACGRRWGKTDACAAAIAAEALGANESHHLILAPTLEQARLLFRRVAEMMRLALGESDESSFVVRRSPFPRLEYLDSTVSARSGHMGSSLRGAGATHVVVDEAAYVPEELVTEVAMPMLATNDGRLTLISTPNGLNHFWKFFRMGEAHEHGVWSRRSPSEESPHVSQRFLTVQRHLISERAFEVEYEAKFIESTGAAFPSEIVDACVDPIVERTYQPGAIGVDWARYDDFTAVAVLDAGEDADRLVELSQFNQRSWASMVAEVAEIAKRYPRHFLVGDATGGGDPVMEMLKDLSVGRQVEGVRFDANAKRDLVEGLRIKLERGRIRLPPHPELIRQLKYYEVTLSKSGSRKMNARSGFHDDLVVALALATSRMPANYRAPVLVGGARTVHYRRRLRFEDLVWR